MYTGAVSPITYTCTILRQEWKHLVTPCTEFTFEPVTIQYYVHTVMVLVSEVGTHPCTIMGIAVSRRHCPVCTVECILDGRGSREREKSASKEKPSVRYMYLRLRKCQYDTNSIDSFNYFGSTMHADGGCEKDVARHVRCMTRLFHVNYDV